MSALADWLAKPRATVRVDAAVPWAAWMRALRGSFARRSAEQLARIEVLTRLSLGGKRSLLLISVEGSRMLVAVGEEGAPTLVKLGRSSRRLAEPSGRSRLRGAAGRRQW